MGGITVELALVSDIYDECLLYLIFEGFHCVVKTKCTGLVEKHFPACNSSSFSDETGARDKYARARTENKAPLRSSRIIYRIICYILLCTFIVRAGGQSAF